MAPTYSTLLSLLTFTAIALIGGAGTEEPLHRYRPYQTVVIDDRAPQSAGLYFRISQRGVDYLAALTSDALPEIFHRMVLPKIQESSLTIRDAVITKLERPLIGVKFVKGVGVDISLRIPEFRLTGVVEVSVFIASYKASLLAVSNNLTINMRVQIHRNLTEPATTVKVVECAVDPGTLDLQYFGPDASEFRSIGNLIQSGIDDAISEKVCVLPPLIAEFLHEKIDDLLQPPPSSFLHPSGSRRRRQAGMSVVDHICGDPTMNTPPPPTDEEEEEANPSLPPPAGAARDTRGATPAPASEEEEEDESPEVDTADLTAGTWLPDPTLRYPPTFSDRDVLVGVDAGMVVDGVSAAPYIQRPKFANLTVIRDQMLGLIISEYVPNTVFHHIYERQLGIVSVSYSIKQIPKMLRSIAKYLCPDCKLVVTANLTRAPHSEIDSNGIVLLLEGDVSATFQRKNRAYNVLSANGEISVVLKPHFRHSRLYSDVLLAGFDLKVYRAGFTGIVASAARKLLSFLVPRAIWPKIQQRLRLAINQKGIELPRFCTLEVNHLHLDYVRHAAILSGDFNVDLPTLIRAFKDFMDEKLKRASSRRELESGFRYLK